MSNDKIVERKAVLEKEILEVNGEITALVEQLLKPAQKSLSDLKAKHSRLDSRYEEICDLLGLDLPEEWKKAQEVEKKRVEEASAEKEIPVEKK